MRKRSFSFAGFFCLLILALSIGSIANSQSIYFLNVTNGGFYDTPAGSTTRTLNFWVGITHSSWWVSSRVQIFVDGTDIGQNYTLSISVGSHTARAVLYETNTLGQEFLTAETNISFTVVQVFSVIVRNSFGGGSVTLDGNTVSTGTAIEGHNGDSHSVAAITRQFDGTYWQVFKTWSDLSGSTSSSITLTLSQNGYLTANFNKEFNVSFQNSLPGASGGSINVNGTQYSAPTSSFAVVDQTSITGQALYQVINGIEYTFSSWSNGSTSSSTTFTPSGHTTYTANFNAKPLPPPSVSAGGTVGSPVQITWSDAGLNSGITQFQIWRMVKPLGGSQGSPQLIATVNRGTTSYTDNDYTVTSTYSNDLLNYDVRSYFSTNGTYSDPSYVPVFGRMSAKRVQDGDLVFMGGELPTEYKISNFPNPFNPSTTISYQLVEEANVTLEIYDVMGRKISSLVQEPKQAGYYTAKWEGKDNSGRQVATGVYLYRFNAIPASGKQPFTKSGKLLLTK